MIKIFTFFLCFILSNFAYAQNLEVFHLKESKPVVEKENSFSDISLFGIFAKKIVEKIIENELSEQLNSKFKADLEIFDIKRLKAGEFKGLSLKSDNLRYKALSLSNFVAKTVNSNNQIVYKEKKIYYPNPLLFNFSAYFTNEDIKNVIASSYFQKELEKCVLKVNNFIGFKILEPIVKLKENRIHFTVPIKTFFSNEPMYVNLSSGIEVKNNEIVLRDITFSSKSNIIDIDSFGSMVDKINPIAFQNKSINTKYCDISIEKAEIKDNIVVLEGLFIVNQNYGR